MDKPRSGKPNKYDESLRNRILQILETPPPSRAINMEPVRAWRQQPNLLMMPFGAFSEKKGYNFKDAEVGA